VISLPTTYPRPSTAMTITMTSVSDVFMTV
jgi:hypothetical protein